MWKWFSKVSSKPYLESDASTIHLVEDHIIIHRRNSDEPLRFRWDDIVEIQTYKIDLLIYDDICLAFKAAGWWYEISESDIGFSQLTRAMQERFPSIDPQWYFTVMLPAFAPNRRTLWKGHCDLRSCCE